MTVSRSYRTLHRWAALGAVAFLAGCAGAPSALQPRGPAAASIATLWWVMLGLASAVFVLVMGLLGYGLFRRRHAGDAAEAPGGERFVLAGGVLLPVVVLTALFVFMLGTMSVLARQDATAELEIEVVGRQWWWEVRYPESGVVTANEIRIPAGRPVRLIVTSGDVIHSVWIPELHGKIDMIPGQTNRLVIIADEPGEYRGECAEFCGAQHARMHFIVVAEPEERFAAWLERQALPAAAPATELQLQGREIFLGAACVYCHAVRGTNASSNFGPDLTHLASRRTLAAGLLENNRGNLAGWILNPQVIKPGNKMPPHALSGEELNALLAYLESLE